MPAVKRTLGPLPLNGGVVLDPSKGRTNSLLDALNVEDRRGSLSTRRGNETMGLAGLESSVQVASAVYPTSWDGLDSDDYVYLKVDIDDGGPGAASPTGASVTPANAFFVIQMGDSSVETDPHEGLTFEYYADDGEWKRLDVDLFAFDKQGDLFFPPAYVSPTASKCMHLRRPSDWTNQDPLGLGGDHGDYAWIRVSRASGEWKETYPTILVFSLQTTRTADLVSFRSRRAGWKTVLIAADSDSGELVLRDVDAQPTTQGQLQYIASLASSFDPEDVVGVRSVYLPFTDSLLTWTGQKWIEYDVENETVAELEVNTTAPQYEGLALRDVFPEPSALAIHDGRLFIAEKDTGTVWYTGPSEFWRVLPGLNNYRLGGVGSGRVLGMAPLHGALYIFTDAAIYSAVQAEPVAGQDARVSFRHVESVSCIAPRSIVASDDGIYFMAADGPRFFNGQGSKRIGRAVRNLFQPDSLHPLAARRADEGVGVYHDVEEQYRFYYPSSDAHENDTCLVVSMPEGRCWLWGHERLAGHATASSGQLRAGVRGTRACWRPDLGALFIADRHGAVYRCDTGHRDGPSDIEWRAETHHINMGRALRQRILDVTTTLKRDNNGYIDVSVVTDGRYVDTRTLQAQRGSQAASSAVDGLDLSAGGAIFDDVESFAPVLARFARMGRNHRVRLASSESNGHVGQQIAGIEVTLQEHRR